MKKENETINEILRGEISAQESYKQVMDKIESDPESIRLKSFLEDHTEAVKFWKAQARGEYMQPQTDSGAWGTAVQAFVGTSKLLGNTNALRALKVGEEIGLNNYKKMLNDDELLPSHKETIRSKFIPKQEMHINSLNAMMEIQ